MAQQEEVFNDMAEAFNQNNASANQADTAAQEEATTPRHHRRRRHHGGNAEQEAIAEQAANTTADKESAEDKQLTEMFGPVDDSMTKLENVKLIDIYPADNDETDGDKWLFLKIQYQPTVVGLAPGVHIDPSEALISLNTRVVKDPNAKQIEYVDDKDRAAYINNLINYAFGQKFGIHNFTDMYDTFGEMLDEGKEVRFDVYQTSYPITTNEGQTAYRTAYRLINRRRQSNIIQTEFVGPEIHKQSVLHDDKLPVQIREIRDNYQTINKQNSDGSTSTYKFAQIEVYVEYDGKNYMVKYPYLKTRDENGRQIDVEEQKADFGKRVAHYSEIGAKLGLKGNTNSLIKQILAIKDIPAYVKVFESQVSYSRGKHKGQTVYYMKLV